MLTKVPNDHDEERKYTLLTIMGTLLQYRIRDMERQLV